MTDIVKRLRAIEQAAQRVMERMREQDAEIERLRAALRVFACDCTVGERCAIPDNCRNFQARRTLEPRHDR